MQRFSSTLTLTTRFPLAVFELTWIELCSLEHASVRVYVCACTYSRTQEGIINQSRGCIEIWIHSAIRMPANALVKWNNTNRCLCTLFIDSRLAFEITSLFLSVSMALHTLQSFGIEWAVGGFVWKFTLNASVPYTCFIIYAKLAHNILHRCDVWIICKWLHNQNGKWASWCTRSPISLCHHNICNQIYVLLSFIFSLRKLHLIFWFI